MSRTPRTLQSACLAALAVASALLASGRALAATEDGGSGVVTVDRAFSLPLGRPAISLQGNLYSGEVTPDDSRFFLLTPSAALGLGGGFEASVAFPFQGQSQSLADSLDRFDHRFDLRDGMPTLKARWTGNLLGPRLRLGALALADVSLGDGYRPGAVTDANTRFDPGLIGLLSTDFGWKNVPFRLHANAGYWWSRNDHTVRYRHHPVELRIPGFDADKNDVASVGVALEAGLRRAVLFAEVITEQLVDDGGVISTQEQYWRLTPGARFMLTHSIALNAALSFDLSSDDPATRFDPRSVYADTELKLGFDFGRVFAQEQYEDARRAEKAQPPPAQAAAARADTIAAPRVPAVDERLELMDAKIRDLELRLRLEEIDNRLRMLEGGEVKPAPSDSVRKALRSDLDQIRSMRHAGTGTSPGSLGPAGAVAVPAAAGVAAATPGAPPSPANGAPVGESEQARRSTESHSGASGREAEETATDSKSKEDKAKDTAKTAAIVAGGYILGRAVEPDNPPPQTQTPAVEPTAEATSVGGTAAANETAAAATGAAIIAGGAVGAAASGSTPSQTESAASSENLGAAGATETAAVATSTILPAPGERRALPIRYDPAAPGSALQDPANLGALDALAAELVSVPDSQIIVFAHAGGVAAGEALHLSDEVASLVRQYLILAGAGEEQVQAMGMGGADAATGEADGSSGIEIARSR